MINERNTAKFQKYKGFREFLEMNYCAFNVDYYGELIKCDRAFCNSSEKVCFNTFLIFVSLILLQLYVKDDFNIAL